MAHLEQLASLITQRNEIDAEIAAIIGRPAHVGHIGEYVAAAIFAIDLHSSAVTKAHDGYFRDGSLAGRSVNIKYGTRRDGMLNLVESTNPPDHPDFYLVLTGPTIGAVSSKGLAAPWVIHAVYLFESRSLVEYLTERGRILGIATSIRKELWEAARIYPEAQNPLLTVTRSQQAMLAALSRHARSVSWMMAMLLTTSFARYSTGKNTAASPSSRSMPSGSMLCW